MNRQIIAIGGGGFGRNPGVGIIEKYILDQSKKSNPNVCFIPTATGDDASYKESYYSTFGKLSCNPTHLDFFKRTPDLKKLISNQDIIFVGGGNTKSMLAVWRDWSLDSILKKAYDSGVILCGVSAGAICWFHRGVTDSWSGELRVMDCLGFVEGTCCPHYDEEPERKPFVRKSLSSEDLDACFSIEGGCALHFIDEQPVRSVVFEESKNAYLVTMDDNGLNEEAYSRKEIF